MAKDAEQVVKKILSDAQAEAEKIRIENEQKLSRQQAGFERELDEYNAETQELSLKAKEDEKAHILASARMDMTQERLRVKRSILDDVFSQAVERLANLGDDQYRELMGRLVSEAVESGDEEILTGKNEKRLDRDFVKKVNRQLGPGFKGNLRLSDDKADISGGFILRRGRVKINASVEVLVMEAREALEIETAKELFG